MADDSKYPTRIAPYGLRMPPDLKERIQASADENGRTLHGELIHTLERAYPEPVYSAEDFLGLLHSLTGPMSFDEQIERAKELNSTLAHFGVELEAHLESGDIVLCPKRPSAAELS